MEFRVCESEGDVSFCAVEEVGGGADQGSTAEEPDKGPTAWNREGQAAKVGTGAEHLLRA